MQYLTVSSKIETDPDRGERIFWNLSAGSTIAENTANTYMHSPVSGHADLNSYINFDWDVRDSWFEEEEEVFRHPRNPYHRIDTLFSARSLDVLADSQPLAQTKIPVVLFETGLPTIYYINSKDINLDALELSDTVTLCPYKSTASYFNIRTNK